MERSTRATSAYYGWGAALLVLAGAVLLRLPGLTSDLWLDELWSLQEALEADSLRYLIFQRKIDNNHHLNSFYLYLIGPQSNVVIYRLFAFVSGIGTVAAAWLIGARHSRLTALVTAVLFGSSYMMAFYASEARGYATVVCLTLAAWYFLEEYAEEPSLSRAAGFAVCSILGVMAHMTFLVFYLAAFVWFDAHESARRKLTSATVAVARLFAIPTTVIGAFCGIAMFQQEIGGGPPYRLMDVIGQTFSAISGGPQAGTGLWIAAALVVAVVVASIRSAHRSGDDRWLLYLAAGLVIPVILVAGRQPPTLSPRYFIVPATVLLFAASVWISRKIAQGGMARVVATALVAAHVTGGVLHTRGDAVSRGHYSEALRRIVASSTGDVIIVASSERYGGHDFRTSMLVDYYSKVVGAEDRIRYVTEQKYPSAGADWLIVETPGERPPPVILDRVGHAFAVTDVYPAGQLSGITWYLYRRAVPNFPALGSH